MKKWIFVFVILLLAIPTFVLMLRTGIYSMQDFHYFRLVEFDKCIRMLQIPCRWALDAGAGYGEPLFNFYGQFPYVIGEIFHLVTFTKIDSLKITFILSLVLSALSMFFLSKKVWKNNLSALVSSVLYLYAPYRAVDVWVRGALPEALSFVFFPLIILEIENYLEEKKRKHLLLFSLLISLLIINHNLSVALFAPFLIIWIIFRFIQIRNVKPFVMLAAAGVFSFLLSAFYLLPVIFESKYVDLASTTVGYFDWRAHFVTLNQLFVSRFWGYGGSTWGSEDGLSLSVGQMQWIVPFIVGAIVIVKHKINLEVKTFSVLVLAGVICLFLTHNQSTFIWNTFSFMKYIQFPWRFLGVALFSLTLASGYLMIHVKKSGILVGLVLIAIVVFTNFNFFRPDIWYVVRDSDLESGVRWEESMFASIGDYWPLFGHKIPDKISDGEFMNYFPGWSYKPDDNGLIPRAGPVFRDTPIRTIGNWISLVSLGIWSLAFIKYRNAKNT